MGRCLFSFERASANVRFRDARGNSVRGVLRCTEGSSDPLMQLQELWLPRCSLRNHYAEVCGSGRGNRREIRVFEEAADLAVFAERAELPSCLALVTWVGYFEETAHVNPSFRSFL